MTDNVIDAANRFSERGERQKATPIDALRRTTRVAPVDRANLAMRLGEAAARLDPERPKTVVRSWFERAWQGDRWAKRKRYVILPGETAPDPRDEGAYVASGADWAVLVEHAAFALHPGDSPIAEADRARAARDLLRGTAFVAALAPIPVTGDNAQALVATYADRISRLLDGNTDIRRLWSVLRSSPFGTTIRSDDEVAEGDPHLIEAALAADAIEPKSDHAIHMGWRTRFTSEMAHGGTDWSEPAIVLGLRAHRRETRMFVVPDDFMSELPPSSVEDDPAPDERILEWLIAKGHAAGHSHEDLPEITYSRTTGIGWRAYPFEMIQFVLLRARSKQDGSPGLWVSAFGDELGHYHPVLIGFDAAAMEIGQGMAMYFLGQHINNGIDYSYSSPYEFVSWPTESKYMPNGTLPDGAASGLIEAVFEELPEVSGWLDDTDNAEVQELLFGQSAGVRFIREISTVHGLPVPINQGTVAAALLTNLAVSEEDRVSERLLAKARARADAGLAFYEAMVSHHRQLIEKILPG